MTNWRRPLLRALAPVDLPRQDASNLNSEGHVNEAKLGPFIIQDTITVKGSGLSVEI